MNRSTDILNELQTISPAVANLGTQMPYTVPAGYFDTLGDVILARVIAGAGEDSAVTSVAGKSTPFGVPEGYFENLSTSILSKIKAQQEPGVADELKELSPVLASISKENVYTVPEGYFGVMEEEVAEKTIHSAKAKVVSITAVKRRWFSYAAAAAVLVMVAFGVNKIIHPSTKLDGYVKEGLKYTTEEQIAEGLQTINETDLVAYLQMTAESKDVETIAAIVDETTLHQEEETVVEDPLLESYMNQLNETQTTTTN
ncbi:MAG: hypothetical protein KGZ74_02210 [Chitinophagaceae bacterium]|nr:hypothetical protein [Chitinophagaceae bacterium]